MSELMLKNKTEEATKAVTVAPTQDQRPLMRETAVDFNNPTPAQISYLQRTMGNQAIQRAVQRMGIQRKMTLGPVGDKYEQEADAVAKQVVGKLNGSQSEVAQRQEEEEELQMMPISTLQRQEEEEELQMKPLLQRQEEEEELQMKPSSMMDGGDISSDIEGEIQSAKGGGRPLSANTQSSMGQAFNADFSSVKVHTNGQADTLNRSLQARAFTTGQDIFFRSGEYNPESSGGQTLLAHELTHTIQQGQSVQRMVVQRLTIQERIAMLTETGGLTGERDAIDLAKQRKTIIKRIKDNYGVDLDQDAGVNAIKKSYKKAPKSVRDGLKPREWTLQELQDVELALSRYEALLGSNRGKNLGDQPLTTLSRLEQGIDQNKSTGALDTTTAGESFSGSKNVTMFDAGTSVTDFVKDKSNPTKEEYRKGFRGTIEHELSHALIEDLKTGKENKEIYKLYQSATRFWTGWNTPRAGGTSNAKRVQKAEQWNENHKDEIAKGTVKKIEPPITNYGAKTASEDLAEAMMFYFEEPGTLQTKCPERHSFIETVIKPLLEKKKKKD